jgi:hypothetical protein
MLEDVVSRIGTAVAASTMIGIGARPKKPRYLLGAAIGIPSAVLFGGHVPIDASVPIGAAYLAGLTAYSLGTLITRDEADIEKLTLTYGLIAGASTAIIRYL